MRLANQLSSFFQVMAWVQSAEGIEARRFLASLDLSDRATLLAVTTPKVDHRLSSIGAHYQNVAGDARANRGDDLDRFRILGISRIQTRILAKLFRRYPVDFVNAASLGDAIVVAGAGSERA
jgi:hypothetical protein